jgi:hypothetical protein
LNTVKIQFGFIAYVAAQNPDARLLAAECALHFLGWVGEALKGAADDAQQSNSEG